MSNMYLSPHFRLSEFTRSATAERLQINNQPDAAHLQNLMQLAQSLEEVRALFNVPLLVSSGYRSAALNQAVGGVATSDHAQGLAVDFTVQGQSVQAVCQAIERSGIRFDQLIFEQGVTDWVHLGIGSRMRQQVLSWRRGVGYVPGIRKIETGGV